MIEWIPHNGSECPCKPGALVEADYGAVQMTTLAESVDWSSVRRYRVRMPEGYATADDRQEAGTHYRDMAVQPWAAMEAWMTPEQFRGFLLGSAVAYLARFNADAPGKGGKQDVAKARHVLDKLLESL